LSYVNIRQKEITAIA